MSRLRLTVTLAAVALTAAGLTACSEQTKGCDEPVFAGALQLMAKPSSKPARAASSARTAPSSPVQLRKSPTPSTTKARPSPTAAPLPPEHYGHHYHHDHDHNGCDD